MYALELHTFYIHLPQESVFSHYNTGGWKYIKSSIYVRVTFYENLA
jgi:hypothetical protein